MATTLTLGVPKKFTLQAVIGDVEQVTCPTGTKTLLISSDDPVFFEVSSAADGAAGTAAAQFRFSAGTFSHRFPGMGVNDQTALTADTVYRFVGSAVSQEVWMMAVAEI